MKQPIRVLALPLYPKQFSSRIRIGFLASPLRQLGIDFDVADPLTEEQFRRWYGGNVRNRIQYHWTEGINRILQIQKSQQYDVLWIQKGLALYPWRLLKVWKSLFSNRVVVDIDDDVLGHPSIEVKSWKRLAADPCQMKRIVASADWVTSGNEPLSESLREYNRNVLTIPSTIPLQDYSYDENTKEDKPEVPTIAWIGTGSNRPYLNQVGPVLSRLAKQIRGLRLLVISDGLSGIHLESFGECRVELEKWTPETESASLRKGWIGIMPLDQSDWASKKSGYKILQYFASGIPAIASPVGVNTSMIERGKTGFLPDSEAEWERDILALVTDRSRRERLGEAGRQLVEEQYSSEKWAVTLANLFKKLGGRDRL